MIDTNLAEVAASSKAQTSLAKGRPRVRFNRAMKLVRRVHLYAGIFMTPWVFLYGVTAYLFNHPRSFSDQPTREISRGDLAGTPLATVPTPRDLAVRVVEAINADGSGEDGGPAASYRLVRPEEAAFARDYSVTAVGGGQEHQIRLDLASGTGSVRSVPVRKESEPEARPPFARGGALKLDPPPLGAASESIPGLMGRLGLPFERLISAPAIEGGRGGRGGPGGAERPARVEAEAPARGSPGRPARDGAGGPSRATAGAPEGPGRVGQAGRAVGGPDLTFFMEGGGKTWRVSYNLQTAAMTGRLADVPASEPLSSRRFLTRLHTAHAYPSRLDSRWAWALSVDLMAASMVGWGFTGLLMWWQMKNLRKVGAIVLVLSVVAAALAAVGMHSALTS